jgi:C4-type Zn-finger protein
MFNSRIAYPVCSKNQGAKIIKIRNIPYFSGINRKSGLLVNFIKWEIKNA